MATSSDPVPDLLAPSAAVSNDHERKKPKKKPPLTFEEVADRKRMLKVLESYTNIWRVLPGQGKKGPRGWYRDEWMKIAHIVTKNPNNAQQVKQWYESIKGCMDYRVQAAHRKGTVSTEQLMLHKGSALAQLFEAHPYEFWNEGAYLAKIFVFKTFGVDVDGTLAGLLSKGQPFSMGQRSVSQKPSSSSELSDHNRISYSDLLSGVPGVQPTALQDIPRMSRRNIESEHALEGVKEHHHQGLAQYAPPPEKELLQDRVSVLDGCMQNAASRDIQTLFDIKQEFVELAGEPETHKQRNPLEHLLSPADLHESAIHFQNSVNGPVLSAQYFGLPENEVERRVEVFGKFRKFLSEHLLGKDVNKINEFSRWFSQLSGYVAFLAEEGRTAEQILEDVTRKFF